MLPEVELRGWAHLDKSTNSIRYGFVPVVHRQEKFLEWIQQFLCSVMDSEVYPRSVQVARRKVAQKGRGRGIHNTFTLNSDNVSRDVTVASRAVWHHKVRCQ